VKKKQHRRQNGVHHVKADRNCWETEHGQKQEKAVTGQLPKRLRALSRLAANRVGARRAKNQYGSTKRPGERRRVIGVEGESLVPKRGCRKYWFSLSLSFFLKKGFWTFWKSPQQEEFEELRQQRAKTRKGHRRGWGAKVIWFAPLGRGHYQST